MASRKLLIAYAGLLADLESFENNYKEKESTLSCILSWVRFYKVRNINPRTRTGFYLLNALGELLKEHPNLDERISLQIWGDIYPGNTKLVRKLNLGNIVSIEPYCSFEETKSRLQKADVLFLPLESELNGQRPLNIPGKLFEYLKLEKPILALCGDSDCKDIIERAGVGIFAKANDIQEIKIALLHMIEKRDELSQLYKADRKWIDEQFSASSLTNKLARLITKTAK